MKRESYNAGVFWLTIVVVSVTVCLSAGLGCRERNSWSSYSDEQRDLAFQKGANRPPTAKTLYAMAKILASQGKDTECRFVLVRLIREYPDFMVAYCDLAELYLRQDQVDAAIQTLAVGLRVSPRAPVILNNLGMCCLLKKDYEKALESFAEAAAIVPDNIRYRSNMAVAMGMLGRYDEALSLFMQVVPPADAHYNLSVVCEARGDHQRAAKERNDAEAVRRAEKSAEGAEEPQAANASN
ncbi:MAG: tetratricopeptide repeat protein [Phycisphaerae bacterium]|nr:tetratricopeptide repeat protein [Phycisphaerae bacterium]